MLRIRFREADNDTVTMRMEGRLVARFAEDVRTMLTRCPVGPKLTVDLSDVTFADASGEELLSWLAMTGARFIAETAYAGHLCELLHLPLAKRRNGFNAAGQVADRPTGGSGAH